MGNNNSQPVSVLMHAARIEEAKRHRTNQLKKDHAANMMIRKIDAIAPLLKDRSQKNPKEIMLIPKTQIHKVLV